MSYGLGARNIFSLSPVVFEKNFIMNLIVKQSILIDILLSCRYIVFLFRIANQKVTNIGSGVSDNLITLILDIHLTLEEKL